MGFGTNIMKSLMFVFNAIVWILGLVLFIVGIVVLVEGENWNEIIDAKTVPVSVLLIIVGFVIVVMGFLGCFGAFKQNKNVLLIYAIILGVIILVQLVAGVLAFIFSEEAEDLVEEGLNKALIDYGEDSSVTDDESAWTKGVDWLQEHLECCGISGAEDWSRASKKAIFWMKTHENDVPDSCCKIAEDEDTYTSGCGSGGATGVSSLINNRGCLTQGIDWIEEYTMIMGICGIVFVAFEVVIVVLACCLRARSY